MMVKKIAFTTLGCKVNLYDTEAMMELFSEKGYEIVEFDDFADIYLINTCTVTNFGDKKSRQMIRRAKRINPNSIIVASGCYAQVAPEELAKITGINIVIGTKERSKIVEIIEDYIDNDNNEYVLNVVNDIMGEHEFEQLSISKLAGRTRAYLKIQEGCNRFCTYCIIPYARGPVRSRKPEDVISEVKRLADNNFKEVVLTGIHVASYGIDLEDMNLIKILREVHKVDGIERIRFSSIEPKIIDDNFINALKEMPKICHHFHLSLQSGCDKTLKAMHRRYTAKDYEEAVYKLRVAFPDVAITTDIIAGFPNESEEDFKECCDFANKIKLTKIHAFPYSPKRGTPAEKMENQIHNDIKSERSNTLIKISNALNREFLSNYIGKEETVLIERCKEGNLYEGHTGNYINVLVESEKNIINEIINVKITEIIKEEEVFGILC